MELKQLASIIQGNIPTRIEVSEGVSIETITMQELNYIANVSDDLPVEKHIVVQGDKLNTYSLTQNKDVVVGLSSGKAIVIDNKRANRLILSNLAIIRIKDTNLLDPYYLCWLINNNKAEIRKMQQGTTAVSIIPLSKLKSFDVTLVPIETQRTIGKIDELKRQRDRTTHSIEAKKADVLAQQLMIIYEKESKDGKKRV
ncbi:MAG TPA: restriction endonuclease subunit S [Firmicutes bacterium]|nr:restriction endonuclease subunit S [Bacillota bacterium]